MSSLSGWVSGKIILIRKIEVSDFLKADTTSLVSIYLKSAIYFFEGQIMLKSIFWARLYWLINGSVCISTMSTPHHSSSPFALSGWSLSQKPVSDGILLSVSPKILVTSLPWASATRKACRNAEIIWYDKLLVGSDVRRFAHPYAPLMYQRSTVHTASGRAAGGVSGLCTQSPEPSAPLWARGVDGGYSIGYLRGGKKIARTSVLAGDGELL